MNQTLSALGERHKGSFQRSLTSRGRAQTVAEKRLLKSPSHTRLCCVLCAVPELAPRGFAGQRSEVALRTGPGAAKRHWLLGGGGPSCSKQ